MIIDDSLLLHHSVLSIQPINSKDLETQLAYEIRAGINDTLNMVLKSKPGVIMEARFTVPMPLTDNLWFPMPLTESSHITMKNKLLRQISTKFNINSDFFGH